MHIRGKRVGDNARGLCFMLARKRSFSSFGFWENSERERERANVDLSLLILEKEEGKRKEGRRE